MVLVETTTGEIVSDLSPDEARDLTDKIKVTVEGAWHLIKQAYETRAWATLGYASWDDYCTREFGGSRLRLPREERQEVVASLRDSGLSTRAIGAATGLSEATVRRDLSSGASNDAPEPEAPDSHDAYDRIREAMTQRPPVQGTDGKTYTAPERKQPSPGEQRAKDIAESHKRAARYITQLTDCWPYFATFLAGEDRAEIEAHLAEPTLDVIADIEEQIRDHH